MIASACKHENFKKHGHDRHGNQRFRCLLCGVTWIPSQPKPLGDMRIDKTKAVLCLRLLLEGNSIRSVERIVDVNRNTILRLLETIGQRALRFWDFRMSNLAVEHVEVPKWHLKFEVAICDFKRAPSPWRPAPSALRHHRAGRGDALQRLAQRPRYPRQQRDHARLRAAAADHLRHPWSVDCQSWRRLLDSSILMICIPVEKLVGY